MSFIVKSLRKALGEAEPLAGDVAQRLRDRLNSETGFARE
jgi:hypothetical protein